MPNRLLGWYDAHHRELPWRTSPRDLARGIKPAPYRVWLSEVMLQQTTVAAVKPYFQQFMEKWPSVNDLAQAADEDVMRAWAGLGYYSRARNLKKCAEMILSEHGGRFPGDAAGLKKLPGIGDYTAAAIAAIAFNERAAVIDGNVERVISRCFAISTPLPAAKPIIREHVQSLTPAARPGDFAQAMMDLGATVCTPKRPACAICPLNEDCAAFKTGNPELYPVKAAKKDKPIRIGAAFIARENDGGSVYLRKRPPRGLLGGMSEVPTTGWTSCADGETGADAAPFPADWRPSGSVTHIFTHFELRLTIYRADIGTKLNREDGWWSLPADLPGEALPTVMKKAIAAAIPDAFEKGRSNA
ncbi:MAG: A/G-specific adenine glycosylase [Phyllobacterium sp.]